MSKTFQPDSLHPYIMDARLKKATGSGGISNIPIASADTVGGIMIGGSANPITITGSGNASVRKATSELLGVVKAGDGTSIDADGAISGVAYSTTEHKIGRKWLDGKDIYERTFTNIALKNNGTTDIATLSGISDVIDMRGIAQNNTESLNARPLPFAATSNNDIRLDVTTDVLKVITYSDWSSYTASVTIQYTKTA